ncbi:MAG: methyl-accepting chemotaxis protein [Hydrogenophilales bacterium]|nr:methyl-accepting chemotaxis protein [Hydrogenophilales bacterium]
MASGLLSVAIAITGLHNMAQMTANLESVYQHRTEAMSKLSKILASFDANYTDVLRGFQHDPEGKTYHLHDHPVTEHTQRIATTTQGMDKLWSDYRAGIISEEEQRLADDFANKRVQHEDAALKPAMAALQTSDYRQETISGFLIAYRTSGVAARQAMEKLIQFQSDSAKGMYVSAQSDYAFDRNLLITLIIVGGGAMGLFIYLLSRSISRSLGEAVSLAEAIAQGDLRHAVPRATGDETGRMLQAMSVMRDSLRNIVTHTQQYAQSLTAASNELSASARLSAAATESQSESSAGMAASVEEMTTSIDQVRDHALDANRFALQSGDQSRTGGEVVHSAAQEIGRIAEAVNNAALTIRQLEGYSGEITTIVKVIHDIADQTNLLALNAAIEAARAGEQGRGFAVVADEVRKLAERTANSTQQIAAMIDKVQEGASKAAVEMESGVERVNEGVKLAHQAGDSITVIQSAAERVAVSVDDIVNALNEQAMASQEIAKGVENIAQLSEENSAVARRTAGSAENLQALAADLQRTIAYFKL